MNYFITLSSSLFSSLFLCVVVFARKRTVDKRDVVVVVVNRFPDNNGWTYGHAHYGAQTHTHSDEIANEEQ